MLRSPDQLRRMHIFLPMVGIWAHLLFLQTAAQPCDPLTQYMKNGQCCQMCGPGTSMLMSSTCQEPECRICGDAEYQDKYTSEQKCQRQPYCDPNNNFRPPDNVLTKKTICMCKEGFHCSAEACITCVPHTPCNSGYGVKSEGNHLRDTVCEKCPKGTFSNEISLSGVCMKWTECGNGQRERQSGTDISDTICEETKRNHTLLISISVISAILVLVIAAVILCRKYGQRDARGNLKGCVESCIDEKVHLTGHKPITQPTDNEEEFMSPEMQSSQEESSLRTPVENEDEPSQEMSSDMGQRLTENGNFVTQENGKTYILSRQESQTHTVTD
ncbi:tumor necrosis factor receptor superfamily member 5 [Morone saxatilis]|uniref:tumor necrosis factor receptor superfamily member 5 n=1 Tax=Morone saxatilis TaxID=34816 RepID=UPI0015E205BB|nr:tumor necrosis factor receptor superfamily member 5 [Morone saxatilis]XP_035512977.1 tumor necrosis factor receptor superfamily member 5 [Morone saxatilis]